eukprot:Sspe_Gene.52383::Locus_29035_Transcript_2_3_Confidence_0.500_Length_1509::g.52383::m.52383
MEEEGGGVGVDGVVPLLIILRGELVVQADGLKKPLDPLLLPLTEFNKLLQLFNVEALVEVHVAVVLLLVLPCDHLLPDGEHRVVQCLSLPHLLHVRLFHHHLLPEGQLIGHEGPVVRVGVHVRMADLLPDHPTSVFPAHETFEGQNSLLSVGEGEVWKSLRFVEKVLLGDGVHEVEKLEHPLVLVDLELLLGLPQRWHDPVQVEQPVLHPVVSLETSPELGRAGSEVLCKNDLLLILPFKRQLVAGDERAEAGGGLTEVRTWRDHDGAMLLWVGVALNLELLREAVQPSGDTRCARGVGLPRVGWVAQFSGERPIRVMLVRQGRGVMLGCTAGRCVLWAP